MFLDLGNKFSIISPTHDFKLVTRLQHVTQAVRAASRAAEKNRMAETFPGRWRRRTLILLFVRLLTASKIGRMPAHLHGSWALRRSKNLKFYIPGHQNEGENAKAHAKISAIVNKNTVGLDGPLADAIQTRFGAICSLLRARRGFRMWGQKGGRKVKSKDFFGHNNQAHKYRTGTSQWRQNCCVRNGTLVVFSGSAGDLQLPQRPPKTVDEFYGVAVFSFNF